MNGNQLSTSPEVLDVEKYTSEVVKGSVYVHPNALGIISDTGRVAMIPPPGMSLRSSSGDVTGMFNRVSAFHGRSLEDMTGLVLGKAPIIDEFGDTYTEYSIKGAANDTIYADIYDIEPSGVRVNGLMDAATFNRVKTVSEVLRKDGVLTEWPIYFARPKHYSVSNYYSLGLLGLKRKLYNDFVTGNEYYKAMDKSAPNIPVGVVGAVGNGLMDMEFGVMYRASLSNARLCDIRAFDRAGLEDRLKNAITSLQLRQPDYLMQWDKIKDLDPEDPEDRQRYLTQVLPKLIAENVAKFHNTNSYHKYLHDGNITLAGELVDLDSVRIPDKFEDDSELIEPMSKMTEALDVAHIVADAISRYMREIKYIESDGTLSISSDEMAEYKKQAYLDIALNMSGAYYAERVLADDITELEKVLLESVFFDHSKLAGEIDSFGYPIILDTDDQSLEEIYISDMNNFFELYPDQSQAIEEYHGYFTRNENTQLYRWAKSQVENRLRELNGGVPVKDFFIKQTTTTELIKLQQIIKFEKLES